MNSQKKQSKNSREMHNQLKNTPTQQLRKILAKLESEHDVLQAKNEDLTLQISDLRNAVKCVQSQRQQNVAYELKKKKQLENQISSLQKGLNYSSKNHLSEAMMNFKALME